MQGTMHGVKTILLVEDDASNAEMLELLIHTETPYRVRAFQNGTDVLEHLEEVKELQPDLFLLDYHLSSMTALDLYDRLHTTEGLEHIPVIVITASLMNELELDFAQRSIPLFYKPFELDDFLAFLSNYLQK